MNQNFSIYAELALLPDGWARNVRLAVDGAGVVMEVQADANREPGDNWLAGGVLLPAAANLHSHAFQRAMAGMSERRGPAMSDSFWTWRDVMYRFLGNLTPDHIEAIASLAFMEMAEHGYASVAEFHYLHHQADGQPYDDPAEMAGRILGAANAVGIGLTLLPVLYQFGGCDGRPLVGGQRRFGNEPDGYELLYSRCQASVRDSSSVDTLLGSAPHSLRAVGVEGISLCERLSDGGPIHIHIAEQMAEVEEVRAATGMRPVEWLMDQYAIHSGWCLVHATHLSETEVSQLAASQAVAGLCPVTEASLGDGMFEAVGHLDRYGRLGVGTDSNIDIGFFGELRMFEYGQRLRHCSRAMFATEDRSAGRVLFDNALQGGAQALARNTGRIAPGVLADLLLVDTDSHWFDGAAEDEIIDRLIFTGVPKNAVRDVWSAGRHVVSEGRHTDRDGIVKRYRTVLEDLRSL